MANGTIAGGRRGTFVGTVNFLAPEMIQNQESFCASDLWALGCIIFKMYTGKVPFPGMSEAQVFPLILGRSIDWPKEEFDPCLKDLIEKLLQMEPVDRLGCPNTKHDMSVLMQHAFFDGIDFNSDLTKTTDVHKLLKQQEIELVKARGGYIEENPTEQRMSLAIQNKQAVLEGLLLKKNKYFMKQERRFKLFATGEIKYYKGQEEKGCLMLSVDSKARKISRYEIELTLNKDHRKTYILL